ncbi:MAG: hypothetical protein KBD43_12765 [Saprospiraceae bacterium]|nr:hypothetical protein [Saprospiraceae bacterium]
MWVLSKMMVARPLRVGRITDFAKADFWLNATIQWAKIAGLGNQREPNKGSPSTLQSRAIK